jgi:hypothetical protein
VTDVLLDYDYHPPDRLQLFTIKRGGVLRADGEVLVTEALHGEVVLRHYAFADRWFKVNCTTDVVGRFTEAGSTDGGSPPFAFNCDIATPMERDGNSIYGVDLFIDVLVRRDASSFYVGDEDEFVEMANQNLLSRAEQGAATGALSELLQLIETGRLLPWLDDFEPFGPCDPPAAPPMERRDVPERMKPFVRSTSSHRRARCLGGGPSLGDRDNPPIASDLDPGQRRTIAPGRWGGRSRTRR